MIHSTQTRHLARICARLGTANGRPLPTVTRTYLVRRHERPRLYEGSGPICRLSSSLRVPPCVSALLTASPSILPSQKRPRRAGRRCGVEPSENLVKSRLLKNSNSLNGTEVTTSTCVPGQSVRVQGQSKASVCFILKSLVGSASPLIL